MQQIFHTPASPEEYWQLGKEFAFPDPPEACPFCRTGLPLKKHGFYRRNSIPGELPRRILIRRYRCCFCGHTVSFLPSFCLPYFQYALELIYQALEYVLLKSFPLRRCLALFRELFKELYWEPAHLRFYLRRFLAVLPRLKLVLRQMFPEINLPGEEDKRQEAAKMLGVLAGLGDIQSFSARFYATCGHCFFSPLRRLV
ncbi:MAG: hypothetical protein H5U00_03095 [Clostridia bacterium]|nr:hypothetical protein [Clostridia bacterium]